MRPRNARLQSTQAPPTWTRNNEPTKYITTVHERPLFTYVSLEHTPLFSRDR